MHTHTSFTYICAADKDCGRERGKKKLHIYAGKKNYIYKQNYIYTRTKTVGEKEGGGVRGREREKEG